MRAILSMTIALALLSGCGSEQDGTVASTESPTAVDLSAGTTTPPTVTAPDESPTETSGADTTLAEESDVIFDPADLGNLGDCFNQEEEALVAVDCQQPHDYQIVLADGIFEASEGAPMPTPEEWLAWQDRYCVPALAEFTGIAAGSDDIGISFFGPTEESWAEGDRAVWCVGYRGDTAWTGTLAGG